ncbi:MAG TPA: ATP-grasp domain-containing protein [Gemmatimonadales bacterium]|nr:ATP-grasp domain-containing protein [Gemmatimonadales bacterium]
MTYDAVVLNGSQRQSLMTVRSLGRRGLKVAAVGTEDGIPTFFSRWCAERVVLPADEGSEPFLDLLLAWLARHPSRVLIPAHDGTIALLRRHRARVEGAARLALAHERALSIAVNKERTLAVAQRLGLRAPRQERLDGVAGVAKAVEVIGLPAVIKPNESWVEQGDEGRWVGPELVFTSEEATRAVERLTRFGHSVLYQQYLTGPREAVSLLYSGGEVYARFAQWAQRTHPPLGGQSVLRRSITIPEDIGGQAERLVREIDLEGYSEIEFRRDAVGVPYLMEINPRLSASVEVAVRAGVDFPWLTYQWASGGPIDRVTAYRSGTWMRHLGGDITTTIEMIQDRGRRGAPPPARAAWDFVRAFFTPTGYDYFQWRDPAPAALATLGFAREFLGRLRSLARKVFS